MGNKGIYCYIILSSVLFIKNTLKLHEGGIDLDGGDEGGDVASFDLGEVRLPSSLSL